MRQVRPQAPPRGLVRSIYRMPIWVFRLGLGSLLGRRFLLLRHRGRRSGRPRETVLEVIDRDPATGTVIVAAGFGQRADWLQNLAARPACEVRIGRRDFPARARRLDPGQAADVLVEYGRRHPRAVRVVARMCGFEVDGSDEDLRSLACHLPMVALEPQVRA